MSQPLAEYSKDAIGREWTPTDHLYLVEQLHRIDALAEALWHYQQKELRKIGLGRLALPLAASLRARLPVKELEASAT